MSRDTRIFRVVRQGYKGREKVKYASRVQVSAMFGAGLHGDGKRPDILRVEAIDPEDVEWADVTAEFRDRPQPRCAYHRGYTGARKPSVWSYAPAAQKWYSHCKCGEIYAGKHPGYATHDPLCSLRYADPASCSCQILKKLTG